MKLKVTHGRVIIESDFKPCKVLILRIPKKMARGEDYTLTQVPDLEL